VDEYLTIVATLLGAVIGGVIGFAGAYLVERQRFKKERVIEMRDKIYGPMFMETSKTLEALKSFQRNYGSLGNLKNLTDTYLFFTIGQDLKSRFSEVMDRFEKYPTVRFAAETALEDAVKEEVEKTFVVKIVGSSGGAEYDYIRLLMGKIMASALDLKSAIFLKLAPRDFIKKEKEKWGKDIQVEVSLVGIPKAKNTLDEFESLYLSILAKMEKEPLYLTEKEQRTRLTIELENLIKQIEPFVKPK
jgi:gas vesicle protein